MAGINITTFESLVVPGLSSRGLPHRLRLAYGDATVFEFPLTEGQFHDLEGGDPDDRDDAREAFVAMKFGELFEMLAEWEAGADARSLEERGV